MEDLTPPTVLYKYYPVQRKDFFCKQLIRFTPLAELNDPYECCIIFGGEYSEEGMNMIAQKIHDNTDIEGMVAALSESGISRQAILTFHNEFGLNFTKRYLAKKNHEEQEKGKHFSENLNKIMRLGIFSLSEVNDSLPMWAHYADNHKGFAIGFNTSGSFFKYHYKLSQL